MYNVCLIKKCLCLLWFHEVILCYDVGFPMFVTYKSRDVNKLTRVMCRLLSNDLGEIVILVFLNDYEARFVLANFGRFLFSSRKNIFVGKEIRFIRSRKTL